MTSEEKQSLALFLDTAADSFRDGYRRDREQYAFINDEKKLPSSAPLPNSPNTTKAASTEIYTAPLPDNTPTGDSLEQIAAEIQSCTRCSLCKTRKNTVPGEGVHHPLVMVIGEGPGADEDASGRPFVGPAGQLLDRMLDSRGQIGLSRNTNCFIANTVKCRPPGNRDPLPEETAACAAFLERQITLLSPKIILCAGRISAHIMLKTEESMGKLRGKFFQFPIPNSQTPNSKLQIPLLATYHPSALLRNEDYKKPSWEDLQLLRSKLAELDSGYADTVRQWVKNGDA